MRISLIIPTLTSGGAERVMSHLANEFVENGHHVDLILLAKAKRFYQVSTEVNVIEMGFENKGPIQKLWSEISVFLKLRKYFSRERPEIALSFMEKYNLLTILASRFTSTKVFVSDRSNPQKKQPFFIELGRQSLYRLADGIVSQTMLSKEILFLKTKQPNIKVIPNPVKEIVNVGGIKKENVILNIGRLIPEKGQKYLVEAFSLIKRNDWKLVILGEGNLRLELEGLIRKLGLDQHVILKGSVTDVDRWLSKSSIFAFSSVSEGYPNALLEAMSAGLPCVSFDCTAGPNELIIHGKNGFLVEPMDVVAMSKYLNILMYDEELRNSLGKNATKIKEIHQLSSIAKQYEEFFHSSEMI